MHTYCGASSPSTYASSSGSSGEDLESGEPELRCVICLDGPNEILALPCRHAVMCKTCAKAMLHREVTTAQAARCPICRAEILRVQAGNYHEEYVQMVGITEERFQWAGAVTYERVYDRIRLFMIIGFLAAVGCACCFSLLPLSAAIIPGACFAGFAVIVGYVPWFLTTVGTFESENQSENQRIYFRFISSDDCSKPCLLVSKVLVLAFGMPIAACLFFIPYMFYKFLIRPVLRLLLFITIRAVCWVGAYIIYPICRCIGAVILAGCKCVAWILAKMCVGICCVIAGIHNYMLRPFYEWVILPMCGFMYNYIFKPCGLCSTSLAKLVYNYIFVPVGKAVCWVCTQMCDAVNFIFGMVGAVCWFLCEWVVKPFCAGIYAVCDSIYRYILVPLGNAIVAVASCVYAYILVPCGTVLLNIFYFVKQYIVVPCAKAVRAIYDCFAGVVTSVARSIGQLCSDISKAMRSVFA